MSDCPFGSRLLALARLIALFSSLVPFTLVQFALSKSGSRRTHAFKREYYARMCRLMGLRIERRGKVSRKRPALFVANHVSYFDIAALGALVEGNFVSRADVRKWPLIGWSASVQGTVFIERDRSQVRAHTDQVRERLERRENLILFPEGTSGNGTHVLPFKSALFSVAEYRVEERPLAVQPVSIAYTKLDGVPMGRYLRPLFAWYGDMGFFNHLFCALSLGVVTVVVEFHPVVRLDEFESRKMLSEHCKNVITLGLSDALSGRRTESRPPAALTATA
jgi:1-acyl-sn-glycerol-3-phosphate acyltransferase